jgi:O-antigen biosynthesis protein
MRGDRWSKGELVPADCIVLDNPFVRYAPPYPEALTSQLEQLVMHRDFDSLTRAASASVRSASWDDAGATVDSIFRRVLQASPQAEQDRVRVS